MTRRSLLRAAVSPLVLAALMPAQAQSRPVTIVVGSTPGGSTDTLGRVIAKLLTVETGRPFVVDNKPGASGNISAGHVARSAPDGQTLLFTGPGLTINASLHRNLPFDTLTDFTPITMVARVPNVLVARKDAPYNTPAEFIAYARSRPGQVNLAVAGQGSSVHLASEEFKLRTGIRTNDVPYKGTTGALTDMSGGSVDLMFAGSVSALSHLRGGKVKAIGIGSRTALPQLPGVPPLAEVLPGFESSAWFGLFGPARMDPRAVDSLYQSIRVCLTQPEFHDRLNTEAAVGASMTPPEFNRFVREDVARWREVVDKAGIRLEG